MNESPSKDLQLFDFNEQDQINTDNHLFNKIPNHDAQINEVGVKNVPSIPYVDIGVDLETGCLNPSFKTMEDTFDSRVENSELGDGKQSNSNSQENQRHFKIDVDYYDRPENRDTSGCASTPETSQIGPSGSPSSKESVDVSSDADDCMNYESAPTNADSDIAENGVFHLSLNGCAHTLLPQSYSFAQIHRNSTQFQRSINMAEQTFIMIKPDGVQRGLVGEIISRFEKKGFYLKGLKFLNVERAFAEKHYADLSAKPFFGGLVEYIVSGPVVAMIWEGKNVVLTGRKIIGATNPAQSEPGTIRGDFAVEIGRNVIHGSDSVDSANKEIALWFPEGPANWQSSQHKWIYE